MVDLETIENTRAQLALHRRRLAYRLSQYARQREHASPEVFFDIEEAQAAIRDLKAQLRATGITAPDDPLDDATTASQSVPVRTSLAQRNRTAMIQKVRTIWIAGLLARSLVEEARIALDLEDRPDAVWLPLSAQVQELRHAPQMLPSNISLIDVFDEFTGELLILGAPGAGKTTLLLELARGLLDRASQDESHPIPVVFNLSSWVVSRLPLIEWLIEELHTKYDVPRAIGKAWVENDALLPLLDGLDEVAVIHRHNCVTAINTYRLTHGLVPLAICSRLADYEVLTIKLHLQGAVVVQPLTKAQIDSYLIWADEKLVGLRAAVQADSMLLELAETPLMLSVMTLAYQGLGWLATNSNSEITTPEERQRFLWDAYIEAMFNRRGEDTRYSREQTVCWLGWLSQMMMQRGQTIFYLENLQPNLLPTREQQLQYVACVGGTIGFGAGLLPLVVSLIGSGLIGSIVGLLCGLIGSIVGLVYDRARRRRRRLLYTMGVGATVGVAVSVSAGTFLFSLWPAMMLAVAGLLIGWFYARYKRRNMLYTMGVGATVTTGITAVLAALTLAITSLVIWMFNPSTSIIRAPIALIVGLAIPTTIGMAIGLRYSRVRRKQRRLLYALGAGGAIWLGLAFFWIGMGLVGGYAYGIARQRWTNESAGPIKMAEIWNWSWRKAVPWFACGVLAGQLLAGLIFLFVPAKTLGLCTAVLGGGLGVGLLLGAALALAGGLVWKELELREKPTQGIKQSGLNALRVWLASGLTIGVGVLFMTLSISALLRPNAWSVSTLRDSAVLGALLGLVLIGPLTGLGAGGLAWIKHYVLRSRLLLNGALPWRYDHFLDTAAERLFLRRVGGGYVFVHRLLLEHFAALPAGDAKLTIGDLPQFNTTKAATSLVQTDTAARQIVTPDRVEQEPNQATFGKVRPATTWRAIRHWFGSRLISMIGGLLVLDILVTFIATILFNLPDPALLRTVRQTDRVNSITFNPDGQTMTTNRDAWSSLIGQRQTWRVSDGVPVKESNILQGTTYSPDGQIFVDFRNRQTIELRRSNGGPLLRKLVGHTREVANILFSPDGQTLASEAEDATIRLWRISDGALLHTLEWQVAHQSRMAFSPDSQMLATLSDNRTVTLWRVSDGEPLQFLDHPKSIGDLKFTPDGQTLVVWADIIGTNVWLWRVSDGTIIKKLENVVRDALSPDGQVIATLSETIQLWRISDGSFLHSLPITNARSIEGIVTRSIGSIVFAPDSQTVLYDDGYQLWLWRVEDGQILVAVEANVTFAFSPDGRTLGGGFDDGTIRLWRVSDGVLVRTFWLWSSVTSLSFSPDSQMLATGSVDGTVQLWRIE